MKPTLEIICGDCREVLPTLARRSIQTIVTSPPYWMHRDYGHDGQIGLENSPTAYAKELAKIFLLVRRVLAVDGTVWLNLGDTYIDYTAVGLDGLKAKDLAGVPWRVAFELQKSGWFLRSDIIWNKVTCMPDDRSDRPAYAHEYIFLLAKAARYYCNMNALRVKSAYGGVYKKPDREEKLANREYMNARKHGVVVREWRARRTVWRIPLDSNNADSMVCGYGSKPKHWMTDRDGYKQSHFAEFPVALPKLCILAGARMGDTVLDPFAGSGTVGAVALALGRSCVLVEAKEKFLQLIRRRCATWKMNQIGDMKWETKEDYVVPSSSEGKRLSKAGAFA